MVFVAASAARAAGVVFVTIISGLE